VKAATKIVAVYVLFALPVLLIGVTGVWSTGVFVYLAVSILAAIFLAFFAARASHLMLLVLETAKTSSLNVRGAENDAIVFEKSIRKTATTFKKTAISLACILIILFLILYSAVSRTFAIADSYWCVAKNTGCIACF
jgi:hypothetical protein